MYSSVAYAVLGDSSNPARAYAISIVASIVLAAPTALALTNLAAPHFGYAGILLVFACIVLSGALVVPFLPGRGGAMDGGVVMLGYPINEHVHRAIRDGLTAHAAGGDARDPVDRR